MNAAESFAADSVRNEIANSFSEVQFGNSQQVPRKRSIAFPNDFRSAILNTSLCAGQFIIPPTPATSENTAVCPRAHASVSLGSAHASVSLGSAPAGHALGLANKGAPPHQIINPATGSS
ncbi:hypothetical protein CDAR_402601 [Caerostris darwini]|uniref:Uncharacterized protein n=1 Tax=Caerostris darwini TaxID=1538125 RepID=A0AAV4S016_9ARAC|nr:hypothetical protein CDAR_402601 [Caerostris darwini]